MVGVLCVLASVAFYAAAQYVTPGFTPPAPVMPVSPLVADADSMMMQYPVSPTIPQSYEDLMEAEYAADLATPSNIKTVVEFDPVTGFYVVRTRVGDMDITTPFYLSEEQYNNWQLRESMQNYYRQRNAEAITNPDKQPFNILDMNFALGPLEKSSARAACS